MRTIDNETFEAALANQDYINIMNKASGYFSQFLCSHTIHECKLIGLWEALRKFNPDKKVKFTSYLFNYVKWICKNKLNEKDIVRVNPTKSVTYNEDYSRIDNDGFAEEDEKMFFECLDGYDLKEISKKNKCSILEVQNRLYSMYLQMRENNRD